MNDRLARLLDQYRRAEAAVDASQAKVRKRSAARLAKLLTLSPQERVRSLDDSGLTLFDREQLARSVEDALPRSRPQRFASPAFDAGKAWRLLAFHRRLLLRSFVALAPLVYFGTQAVLATPAQTVPVTVEVPLHVNWSMPGGFQQWIDTSADSEEVWVRVNGQGYLRRWIPGQGYALSPPIPESYWADGTIKPR